MPFVEYIRADAHPRNSKMEADDVVSYERDIGRLEAVAQSLERQINELKQERDEIKREIQEIKELISQIRGGSRVVFWIGGLVSGGIGAALFKFLPMLPLR